MSIQRAQSDLVLTVPESRTNAFGFSLACAMAFLAGATDVCGLSRLHNLFVSFMSGNTTMLAFALGHGDISRAAMVAQLVGLFVGGACLGTIIAVFTGRRHLCVVTFIVAMMLLSAAFWTPVTIILLALAMGILNAAMHRAGATGVSLTYVTGALVKFAQGLGHAICGHTADRTWPLQALLWLALLAGAAAATLTQLHWPTGHTLMALSGFAVLIAAASFFRPDQAAV